MASIEDGRHYEIISSELADWLEERAANSWWYVDGDPLLTGRIPFPAPSDELAAELRKINRPLLVEAPPGDDEANAQTIEAEQVGDRLTRWVSDLYGSTLPSEAANDRYFYLQWKGSPHEWLLVEDGLTAEQFRQDATSKAN